jgi:hypothetical protein
MSEQSDFTIPCLHWSDSYYSCNSLGRAGKAGAPYMEGVYWYEADEKLSELTCNDIWTVFKIPRAFGSTTQGDTLHEITPEIADRLCALNAEKAAAKAAKKQAEMTRRSGIDALVAAIPKGVQAERRRLMQEYRRGMLEGGEGYNPYADWSAPLSLMLLRKRCPEIAQQLEAFLD